MLGRRGDQDRVLLQGGTVLSMDAAVGDHVAADILIEGKTIAAVAPDLAEAASDGQAVVVDASGLVLIPGMHDTHRHCWQNQFRRLVPDIDSVDAYLKLAHGHLALHYRPHDIYVGTLISALGCLDAGITCVMDFSHNSRTAAHSDAAIGALRDAGIRGVHATCAPLYGDWDRQWPADITRLKEQYFASDDQLLTLRLGLLASRGMLAVSPEWLTLARDLGIGVSIDGVSGRVASANIEKLGHDGLLADDITLIHCSDLTDTLWRMIADSGTTVSLAPTSDAQIGIAASIPPIQQALDFGVRPSLSVDVEIALSGDMFTQMRVVLSTQRMLAFNRRYLGDPDAPEAIGVRDALEFATVQGAHANGLLDKVGTITPGKEADIVAVGAYDINTMPLNNAVGTVVSGADARNVEMVFVAGQVKKWRGELLGHDLGTLRKLVQESRDHVVAASGYELDLLA
ncbi:MAG TPA: amidohydrolase family protein [Solirubrobacteraceae bacterium]|jgi:cytosine/adenosine deaminase-related metal-dependent hydrolase